MTGLEITLVVTGVIFFNRQFFGKGQIITKRYR